MIMGHPLAWSDGGNRLILMLGQLLIHNYILQGDKFMTRWYPDLIGLGPVCETTEYTI